MKGGKNMLSNAPAREYRCMSTDPNPTGDIEDGAALFEKDTFKVFFYDKGLDQWVRKNGEVRS